MRSKCASHCGGCGRHFAGDTAFDAHRRGKNGNRYCADPQDVNLVLKRTDGTCDLFGPPQVGAHIWQTPPGDRTLPGRAALAS